MLTDHFVPTYRLTNTFCWHLSGIATFHSDKLTNVKTNDPEIQTNNLITNIFLEVCFQYLHLSFTIDKIIISNSLRFIGLEKFVVYTEWIPVVYTDTASGCRLNHLRAIHTIFFIRRYNIMIMTPIHLNNSIIQCDMCGQHRKNTQMPHVLHTIFPVPHDTYFLLTIL